MIRLGSAQSVQFFYREQEKLIAKTRLFTRFKEEESFALKVEQHNVKMYIITLKCLMFLNVLRNIVYGKNEGSLK